MRAGDRNVIAGFTLIELLVAIAIFVIIATVAIPNFSSIIARNRLAAEYNNILTGLHFARSEAVKRRDVVRVEINSDSGDWKLDVKFDSVILKTFASTGGAVQVNNGAPGVVEFNALGRRVPGSCSFASCKIAIGNKEVEINPAGNIVRLQP